MLLHEISLNIRCFSCLNILFKKKKIGSIFQTMGNFKATSVDNIRYYSLSYLIMIDS